MIENMLVDPEEFNLKARSSEEVTKSLHTLRVMRTQCLIWYEKARDAEDLATMFLLESEIQYLLALEAGVKWALGINRDRLIGPKRVAVFNQRREMDAIEATEGF